VAGKKPAKGNSLNKVTQPEKPGKVIKYIGAYKGVFHTCPTCKNKTGRGLLFEYKDSMYCSRNCIPKDLMVL
jgi:hypothetical protein